MEQENKHVSIPYSARLVWPFLSHELKKSNDHVIPFCGLPIPLQSHGETPVG
jgi:hypothetical protein